MKFKNRWFHIGAVILFLSFHMSASVSSHLQEILKSKKFDRLPELFADSSHALLPGYFRHAVDLRLVEEAPGEMMGFVKFPRHAEIVRLVANVRKHRLSGLEFTRMLHPLDYIHSYRTVSSRGMVVKRGDARFQLISGSIQRGEPFDRLLLFTGKGDFEASPADPEEKLTLKRLYGTPEMSTEFNSLLFLSDHREIPLEGEGIETVSPSADSTQKLLERFSRQFGVYIPAFSEYWYPRFSNSLNLGIFEAPKGRCFQYQYNPSFVPDTTLAELLRSRYILTYNREAGLKMSLNPPDRLRKMQLNLFLNPDSRFLWGTSLLFFKDESELYRFTLNPSLKVLGVRTWGDQRAAIFSPGGNSDLHYLRGTRMRKVMVHFSGKIRGDTVKGRNPAAFLATDPRRGLDPYILWNRDVNFYPSPTGSRFKEITAQVSVPREYNCLVSGQLVTETVAHGRRKLLFKTPATKGVGLVCGDFVLREKVDAPVPVHIYANTDLAVPRIFDLKTVESVMEYLVSAYGRPTAERINLVLRRWNEFGGISYQGLVVMNVPGEHERWTQTTRRRILNRRPTVITRVNQDSLVHELAHQWWGGEVSWNSYRDIWITEGLAQFSTLFYHRRHLSARAFSSAVRRMKRWVIRHSDSGPVVYGLRIANLTDDMDAMQSVVYNKSALIFAMLSEIMGEREMYARLREVLSGMRYRNITSSRFMSLVSGGDPLLEKFLDRWVNTRHLPRLRVQSSVSEKTAMVTLEQDGDFVIPLSVKVATHAGVSIHPLVLDNRRWTGRWVEKSRVRSVEVIAEFAPVIFD